MTEVTRVRPAIYNKKAQKIRLIANDNPPARTILLEELNNKTNNTSIKKIRKIIPKYSKRLERLGQLEQSEQSEQEQQFSSI